MAIAVISFFIAFCNFGYASFDPNAPGIIHHHDKKIRYEEIPGENPSWCLIRHSHSS